jgi:hypothetical protein
MPVGVILSIGIFIGVFVGGFLVSLYLVAGTEGSNKVY